MIRVFFGNEPYFIQLKKKEFKSLGTDVPTFSELSECCDYLNQNSLFSVGKKYAVLSVDSLKALDNKLFLSMAEDMDGQELFIEVKKVDERTKFYKEMCGMGTVSVFPAKKAAGISQAAGNLVKAAQLEGIELDVKTAEAIVLRTNYIKNEDVSLITLMSYVVQLSCVGFSDEAFEKVVPDLREGNGFNLAGYLASGNADKVAEELGRLKDPALKLLGLLHWELRSAYLNAIGIPYSESHGRPGAFSRLPKEKLLDCIGIVSDMQQDVKRGIYADKTAMRLCCSQIMGICRG